MSITFALRGPGLDWLPRPLRTREYWALVGRFVLFGPLIGGLPYAWLIITLPLVFGIGLGPALIAGMLYAAWWVTPSPRRPTPLWRATLAAICAIAGCAAVAWMWDTGSPGVPFVILAVHGVPAAVVLGLATRAQPRRFIESGPKSTTCTRAVIGSPTMLGRCRPHRPVGCHRERRPDRQPPACPAHGQPGAYAGPPRGSGIVRRCPESGTTRRSAGPCRHAVPWPFGRAGLRRVA